MVAKTPQSAMRSVDTKICRLSHSVQTEYLFLQKAPNQTMKTQAENILQHAIIRGDQGRKKLPVQVKTCIRPHPKNEGVQL